MNAEQSFNLNTTHKVIVHVYTECHFAVRCIVVYILHCFSISLRKMIRFA